jgi:Rap1a immunity proteins
MEIMRVFTLIAALLLNCGTALSASETANQLMPACHKWINGSTETPLDQGICMGIVIGVAQAGDICTPSGVTNGQALRVVVQYVDQRPARMHESFRNLAHEALKAVWPCQ